VLDATGRGCRQQMPAHTPNHRSLAEPAQQPHIDPKQDSLFK
jgi:hypothetical protein